MQASAPLSWSMTASSYSRKFLWMMLLSLGCLMSSGRRVRATTEVIWGWARQRSRTHPPTLPVEPVTKTFIVKMCAQIAFQ